MTDVGATDAQPTQPAAAPVMQTPFLPNVDPQAALLALLTKAAANTTP